MAQDEGQEKVLQILNEARAVITNDHLVYTSGRHGSVYVNKDAVYPNPRTVAELCGGIAAHFWQRNSNYGYEVVVGPEKGGIILAQWTAYQSYRSDVPMLAVYAEKEGDGFAFHRGYDKLITGKKVLIVEDILTTGGSVKKVVEAVRAIGGEVVGVGALCNRGGITPEDIGDVPALYALLNLSLESWAEADCPLCKEGKPINVEIGKGREFLASKAKA